MKLILQYESHIRASIYLFKVYNRNTGKRYQICSKFTSFSSVSIVDFEQVNVSPDVSEKPNLLPNNFKISRSFYYFVSHYLIVMQFPRKSQDKKTFSTKEQPLIKKNQPLHTKQIIYFLVSQRKNFGTFFLSKR